MKQYLITGMSCAACQARIEKAVAKVPGVEAVTVSLLTNSMGVTGTASDEAVIQAVTQAGYGASVKRPARQNGTSEDGLTDRESPKLFRRLLISLGFLLILLWFSMGHSMWGFPVPGIFSENPVAMGLLQMALSLIVMIINRHFFISGFQSVLHGAPNMDTLVSLGSSASFLWSVYELVRLSVSYARNGSASALSRAPQFYFESAAMILVLITVGKLLETKSKGKTTNALKALIALTPKTASVLRDGSFVTVPAEEVSAGDIFLVKPGENIPVDGLVTEGFTAVDESALTGEGLPVDKAAGDFVSAGTLNQNGAVQCKATRVGEDTTLSQIIQLVSDATATKAPIAKIADKVSGIFVPVVIGIALITLAIWLLLGKPFDFALARSISVLVISCPCALGLATPVAITVAGGVGARYGILFKTAASLEAVGKTGIAVLDKTGTVTKGMPEVAAVLPSAGSTEEMLLHVACSLEQNSEHPLAKAVITEAERRKISVSSVTDFTALPGRGLTAVLSGNAVLGGSLAYLQSAGIRDSALLLHAKETAEKGQTALYFAEGGRYVGCIAVTDSVKEESAGSVKMLHDLGIEVVLLSGDRVQSAKAVGEAVGITNIVGNVLPNEKEAVIKRLQKLGKVLMVGDGINDAPALASADMGIAIGAGSDIALSSADVVLVNSKLSDVPAAIRLSRKTLKNIKENLFWAFFYNVLCIPLAAGLYTGLFGWTLNPMIGALAMSLSSFCVVLNALRLNLFRPDKPEKARKNTARRALKDAIGPVITEWNSTKENCNMTKTLRVSGMMCPHCEAHVKKALEALDGVENAIASHTEGTAVLNLSKEVPYDVLKAAVEAEGYSVTVIN